RPRTRGRQTGAGVARTAGRHRAHRHRGARDAARHSRGTAGQAGSPAGRVGEGRRSGPTRTGTGAATLAPRRGRGTRPARCARRRGAPHPCAGRTRRPPAGFPDAGIQPRSQHAGVQIRRSARDTRCRRSESVDRADARTGAEPRMSGESVSGKLFIVAAPSGAGKSTLVNALLAREPGIALSISHTTRAPRPGDIDGVQYHFVDRATFEAMVARGDFLEHADVFGNYYGTSRGAVEPTLEAGRDV